MDPAHYRLAEAGLWWDSFEEEPEFEVMEYEFDELTLHEGDRNTLYAVILTHSHWLLSRNFIQFRAE